MPGCSSTREERPGIFKYLNAACMGKGYKIINHSRCGIADSAANGVHVCDTSGNTESMSLDGAFPAAKPRFAAARFRIHRPVE